MTNVFDYLRWRGDLTFEQDPFNAVDGMIFSCLAYIRHNGRAVDNPNEPLSLVDVASDFLALTDCHARCRNQSDIDLLKAVSETRRFGAVRLVRYRDQFVPEEDTQFAAGAYLLDDGSMALAFRGTDNTLVGWKEDFNMCFRQTVPSQRLAQEYVRELYAEYGCPMHICGHSKGGNLAIFAAARSSPMLQQEIRAVWCCDGPGFTDYMMGDPGYLAMVPRIHSYIPQSSVIGTLMEHEEPLQIVHSNQISGVFQHDTFSWEVMGNSFVSAAELTSDAKFMNAAIKKWLLEMDTQERNQMVESLFELLTYGNVERTEDILHPKNLVNYIKLFGTDETIRKVLSNEFENFLDAAIKTKMEQGQEQNIRRIE